MYANVLSPCQVSGCPTPACCLQMVKLKAFGKFENTTDALAAAASLVDSKLSKGEHPLPPCPAGLTVMRKLRALVASLVVCAASCTSSRNVPHPILLTADFVGTEHDICRGIEDQRQRLAPCTLSR